MATQTKNEETSLITLTVAQPDEALFRQSADLLLATKNFEITSADMALKAGVGLKEIKALAKELNRKRIEITGPFNQGLKKVNDLFRPAKDWLTQAEELMKSKLLYYQQEQDRIAREAQAKADEEARKERVKLEKAADLAAQAGMDDRAEELEEQAQVHEAPVIQSAAPKLEGIHTRVTWKAEVTNKMEFVKYVIEKRPDLLWLIEINQSKLNAQAIALKESLDLPGIKAVKEESITARS